MGQYKETCKVNLCNKNIFCKGYCKSHYRAFSLYGNPLIRRKVGTKKKKAICSIMDCNNYVRGHGLCNKHYLRFKRYGDTNKSLINRGCKIKWKINNCKFNAVTLKLCKKHYKQSYYKKNPDKSLASSIRQH